jgi:hypothetical protein
LHNEEFLAASSSTLLPSSRRREKSRLLRECASQRGVLGSVVVDAVAVVAPQGEI